MPVFESVICELLQIGYVDIICYVHQYFAVDKIKPINLWSKICLENNNKKEPWHDIILLGECVYALHFQMPHLRGFLVT